jgi:hypothetical protein
MQSFYKAAHALTMTIALLVLVASFVLMLFGWAVHGLIAALVFSSCFTLAKELQVAAVSRRPALQPRSRPI